MSSSTNPHFDVASLLLVPKHTFLGLAWGCVGVSFCFLAFRIYVRLRCFNRLSDDDIFVILAWLILLTTAILWGVNHTLDFIYVSYRSDFGGVVPPASFLEDFSKWLRLLYAITFLNMAGLWCVKLSFLAFFRRLGRRVKGQKAIWWSVLAVTIAGWAISVGVVYYPCAIATLQYETAHCDTLSAGVAIRRLYRVQIGLDFSTDLLIMAIPVHVLWNVQISLRQKFGILALFALSLITMVLSIVRVEVAIRGPTEDVTWFYICTTIELTIAILVTCLVSYRALFTRDVKHGRPRGRSGHAPLHENPTDHTLPYTSTNAHKSGGEGSESSSVTRGEEEVIPLDTIHVRNEYTVRSEV